MRGHEIPENHPLTILKGFSTVSEVPLPGNLGRIIVLLPIIRRIEIEERFRPVKADHQKLVVLVFDNLPKPNVGEGSLFANLFPKCF